MKNKKLNEQAYFIFNTGKKFQDYLLEFQSNLIASGIFKDKDFGEMSLHQLHVVRTTRDHGQLTITQLAKIMNVPPKEAFSYLVDLRLRNQVEIQDTKDKSPIYKSLIAI